MNTFMNNPLEAVFNGFAELYPAIQVSIIFIEGPVPNIFDYDDTKIYLGMTHKVTELDDTEGWRILLTSKASISDLTGILIHELAHTVVDQSGHGKEFKSVAKKILDRYMKWADNTEVTPSSPKPKISQISAGNYYANISNTKENDMNELSQILYVDVRSHSLPVGIMSDYIDLTEKETIKLLYRRLNAHKIPGRRINSDECAKHAKDIRNGPLKKYLAEFTEVISIPIREFFEDMEVLRLGIDVGPFYEYAEFLSEVPMVDVVICRDDKCRISINDLHEYKPLLEQQKIALYAVRWKMETEKKLSNIPEEELISPLRFSVYEIETMEEYRKELIKDGIKCPPGEIVRNVGFTIKGFKPHALQRAIVDRNVVNDEAIANIVVQEWINNSVIMLEQPINNTRLYIAFDCSAVVEVIGGKINNIYPSTTFGDGPRLLMQKAISLIKDRIYREYIEPVHEPCFLAMASRLSGEVKIPNKPEKPGMIIAVGAHERGDAHFHIFKALYDMREWSNGACLLYEKNAYYNHRKHRASLDKDELDAVVQKLNSRHESFPITYWDWMVGLWNSNNGNYAIAPNIKMPLYDHDTLERHEEPKQN